ncbi:MAG: dihydrofolate reductase family protein [Acidimicrobiales bacterium]
MVTSVDGAATVDGRSGELGGAGRPPVFGVARRRRRDPGRRRDGARRGLPPAPGAVRADGTATPRRRTDERPRLCIVTRRSALPDDVPLLAELDEAGLPPERRPLWATTAASAGDVDDRFEVIDGGADTVDLGTLLAELGRRGLRRVLCEGGPSLLGQLTALDLVDEWNFTIAPTVVGGTSTRSVLSPEPSPVTTRLERLLVDDDSTLFARYLTVH